MFTKGLVTSFLFLASLITFVLAIQFPEYFRIGTAFGGLLFIVAAGMLIFMMRKRMDKQNF